MRCLFYSVSEYSLAYVFYCEINHLLLTFKRDYVYVSEVILGEYLFQNVYEKQITSIRKGDITMNELIFVLLICPLLIFIVSVIGTRRTRTYYVMPIVTFASFLIVGAIAFPPKFFFWVGMYSIFSFITSYMTLLFVRGYEVAENNK